MVDQKVVEYIQLALTQGKTREDLYKELLGVGWTIEAIQENFGAINAEQNKEDTSKRAIRIIVTIAALFIGAGIFSFIASNWQGMFKSVKIGVILISMLGAYGAGWYLKERLNLVKTGNALIFLGLIIYGAGIFLIAQMFHTRSNWPDGFILWMFGVIAMTYATETFSYFYFALFLGFIAMIGHPIEIFSGIFGYRAFLLTSSFLLLAFTAVTFMTGWIVRKEESIKLKEFY